MTDKPGGGQVSEPTPRKLVIMLGFACEHGQHVACEGAGGSSAWPDDKEETARDVWVCACDCHRDFEPLDAETEKLIVEACELLRGGLASNHSSRVLPKLVRDVRRPVEQKMKSLFDQLSEARQGLRKAVSVALTRPHDGSQLDEDLEGLLLSTLDTLKAIK